jgi:CHRD domain-containing protein
MRRYAWAIVAAAVLSGVSCNDALEDREVFEAVLSPAEEVPARPSAASGRAQVYIDGDRISYAIEVDDITAITAAHIHSGPAGVNGPIRLFLWPIVQGTTVPQVTTTDKGILVEATVPSSNVNGVTYQELLTQMRSGGAYVNVHTVQFGGGEMRGQVRPLSVD